MLRIIGLILAGMILMGCACDGKRATQEPSPTSSPVLAEAMPEVAPIPYQQYGWLDGRPDGVIQSLQNRWVVIDQEVWPFHFWDGPTLVLANGQGQRAHFRPWEDCVLVELPMIDRPNGQDNSPYACYWRAPGGNWIKLEPLAEPIR